MRLETDPKAIERLAREREDENGRFRSFLKGVHLEDEVLDALVHRHLEEVSTQVDCCACANCCREVLPVLEADDVARLARGLGLSEEGLTERYLVPDEERKGAFTFNQRPCPLLSENRCAAYASRPETCRSFPHLHKDEFRSRLMQVVSNCEVCPIVFHVYERLKDDLWHPGPWDEGFGAEEERSAFDDYETVKRDLLMDRVDEVFRDRPEDWRAGLEELGFESFEDDEDLEEMEKQEEREAVPENPRQQALVDYFEGRRVWSEDLLEAYWQEKEEPDEPNFALFRRYFRQANPNLKSLLLHGVKTHPDRVGFLMDLSFFNEFEQVLGPLIEGYKEACVEETDLDAFMELAQDFYDATVFDGYEAYEELCDLFEPGTEKRRIVEFLMEEGEDPDDLDGS